MAVNKKNKSQKKTTTSTKSVVSKGGVSPKVKTKKLARNEYVDKYLSDVKPALMKKFGYKSSMQIPKIIKVVFNRGVGEVTFNPKALDSTVDEMFLITEQRPIIKHAKKSIANFKLREGMPIGCMVTLRGNRMYSFIKKLVEDALPRIRDFKGLSPHSFDGRGNYYFGVKEQLIFPVIDYDKVDKTRGFNVSFVTTANTDEEARELLGLIGLPFREN
ncbi:MAG: 50S ribosomal protein L5 [Caldisericia bacterium]|nr:50S ribosomal protein L5 [Caldisericia bacterium]